MRLLQQAQQVLAVVVDELHAPRDLLDRGDLEALSLLDGSPATTHASPHSQCTAPDADTPAPAQPAPSASGIEHAPNQQALPHSPGRSTHPTPPCARRQQRPPLP